MPIPTVKKDYLKSVGVSDEVIEELESTMQKSSETAIAEGIVSKEVEGEQKPELAKTEDTPAVVGAEESVETPAVEEKEAEVKADGDGHVLTKEEISQAIAESLKGIISEVNTTIQELKSKVESLSKEVADQKEDAKVTKEQMELTPTSSLAALISRNLMASTSDDTILRKNSSLTKEKPEETESPSEDAMLFPQNPLLSKVVSGIIGKDSPTQ